jgi:signal transduction histidine kinase
MASLKETYSGEDPDISSRIERLGELGELLDSEISFLAWELRPSALDDVGLVEMIATFVREWSRHYETPADFHSSGVKTVVFDDNAETHIYRIAQEALNNIAKHAKASSVSVLLERRENDVLLIIEDDGVGFLTGTVSRAKRGGKGLGLRGMSERATLIGGSIEIESVPGKGTSIFVRIPVRHTEVDGMV